MKEKIEQEIYMYSETLSYKIASFLNSREEKRVSYKLILELVKDKVADENLIDDVFRITIILLEEKYGILISDRMVDI